tara:strand:+ start:9557 stop:11053 length:1497 start_codon:yes stop_codon:yes gene_type:complete
MSFQTGGSFPASLVPAQKRQALSNNYLNFADGTSDWAQQYLPELYEQEVERYGNRTLSGFLRMVGAEMPMTSDQVIWSEQNRLHVAYNNARMNAAAPGTSIDIELAAANPIGSGRGANTCAIKVNQTIMLSDNATGLITAKALVTTVTQPVGPATVATIVCVPYAAAAFPANVQALLAAGAVSLFVYGSEWEKGSTDANLGSIEPGFTEFNNSPIIIRDKYQVNGSDAAQIGWIEVSTEDGTSGYLWYLKAESETRLRFEDYMEMALVEGELAVGARVPASFAQGSNLKGTQGLFAAIEARGNVYQGFAGAAAPGAGAMGDFDAILQNLDKQGAIEENMLFLQRQTALDFDDMIAAQAGGGFASTASASYGLFDNEEDMALNFGFSGFRRGSYDFYKTDWKYLNDASTRGLSKSIDGVLVPAGTSTVYDQMLGSNIRRPFLHVRYRASESEDRRYKNWITGSVGGAYTDGVDAMSVHFLTERCLVTQAANNFVLFKSV